MASRLSWIEPVFLVGRAGARPARAGAPLAEARGLRSVYDKQMDLVTGYLVRGTGVEGMTVHPGGAT